MSIVREKLTHGERFKLFLVCAFPLHAWTIIMALRDVSWVAERTNVWDSAGFTAYALLYTLVESAILFGFVLLLGLLLPRRWDKKARFMAMGLIAFILAGWSIVEQLFNTVLYSFLQTRLSFFIGRAWAAMLILGVLILLSTVLSLWLVDRKEKTATGLYNLLDRLTMLSGLYLIMDAAGLVIVIIRNV